MSAPLRWRSLLGAAVYELPIALWGLRPWQARETWVHIRNRSERLASGPGVPGVRCEWRWTSSLHVTRVFPRLGRRLLGRAVRAWPIEFAAAPPAGGPPQVTFVIGHRGLERTGHLLLTLASIAAQRGASIECVVVEQAPDAELRDRLPAWVRYAHTPPPRRETAYNRAWAFNVGARLARGALLVMHDNDMLVPRDYARELLRCSAGGYEVINLKRFLFYLGPEATRAALADGRLPTVLQPDEIVQNAEAGGSVAVTAEAFDALGGFDEGFVGWGGEDNEFWERAQLRRVYPWGYLPLVHLWHAPQPGKGSGLEAPAVARYHALRDLPVEARVAELRRRAWGRPEAPWSPSATVEA